MTNDDQQPDIYSFPGKEAASSESAALDEALLDAVDGVAQSLRDDEQSMRDKEKLQRQRQLFIFGAIFLAVLAVPLVLLSFPQSVQKPLVEKIATRAPRTKTPRKVNEVQSNHQGQAHTHDDSRLRSGYYTMLLPRGFKWQVELLALGQKRYRLKSSRSLNNLGVYEVQGNLLVMVKPDDKRLTEFQWQITDNHSLKLVAEPHARKTGGNYLGTTLTRNP